MFSGMTVTFLKECVWGFGVASPVLAILIALIGQLGPVNTTLI